MQSDITVLYRHWPLSYHADALPAALAAECAGQQGHFHQFADSLFAGQAELGRRRFNDIADGVGVPNLSQFAACLESDSTRAVVLGDQLVAESIGSMGTPTVILDGVLLGTIPNSDAVAKRLQERKRRQ